MTALSLLHHPSTRNLWGIWLVLILAVCSIHLVTLEIDPLVWHDEVQIIDQGRASLNPSTNWALTWNVRDSTPIMGPSHLGIILQEAAFKAFSTSSLGPRYMGMLAALLAATCAFGWLMARKTPPLIAMALAFAFLIDPIFSEFYRGGRIDGWVFAACLGSCWLLRAAMNNGQRTNAIKTQTFFAGALLAASPFFWASAPIVAPLVLLEFYYLARSLSENKANDEGISWVKAAWLFCLGGFITCAVLLVPVFWSFDLYLNGMGVIAEMTRFTSVVKLSIIDMFLVHDPILFIVLLVSLLIRREIGMLIAFAIALLMVHQTQVYLQRVVYFLPYFIAALGFTFTGLAHKGYSRVTAVTLQSLLVVLLGWNTATVLIIKPAVAMAQRPANAPQQFLPALNEAVGSGPHRVLLKAWPAYYAGRTLGWNMYLSGNAIANDEYTRFLSTMDYVLLPHPPRDGATSGKLGAAGFELKTIIDFERSKASETGWWFIKLDVPPTQFKSIRVYHKKQAALKHSG